MFARFTDDSFQPEVLMKKSLLMSLASLLVGLGLVVQANAADTASIKVTVTGQDGKPAASVPVRLLLPPTAAPAPAAPADKAKEKVAPADKAPAADTAAKPTKIQETTTNDKGEATLTGVAAGDYIVNAGNKDAGQGRQKVSIKAGETVTVAITLKAPKAK